MLSAPRDSKKWLTVLHLSLLSACAPKQPAEDDPFASYDSGGGPPPASSSSGASPPSSGCEVRGAYGLMKYRALVQGHVSQASLGLVKTKAELRGDSVVYHHGIVKAQAGSIEAATAHFTLHLHNSTSSPITAGATTLPLPPAKLIITSQGCTTREVAFGTLHLAAMITLQRNQQSY